MLVQLPKNTNQLLKENPVVTNKASIGKLEFSELRYRRLFETAQDGILILDADSGKIVDANPFLKEILGYSHKELLGKELWEIGVFKDIKESKKAFIELQTEGYIRYKDLPLETKDGRSIDVEFVSNVYMVGTEKVIQCNIRDITSRKKAENEVELRTKELERLGRSQEETKKAMLNVMEDLEAAKATIEIEKAKDEAMLASIGEGLIAVDINRRIVIINRSAEKMLGYKMKDLVGKEITILSLEDEERNMIAPDKRPTLKSLVSGKTITATYYFVRHDGSRLPVAIYVTPVKLGGKIIGAIQIFRDVTREREIDKAKSEFVSLASHQLRTPLGISKWYLEALKGEGFLEGISDKAKDYLNEVYKSNERLLALVRGLLSVSRIDQGTIKDNPEPVDVIKLVRDVTRELGIIASKNNISINLAVKAPKIPMLFIDPLRLQQVIENLVANAIEYSNPGSAVEIVVDKGNQKVLISVKDHGMGIAVSDQKKLFTKFFRTPEATVKNTEGSGLGLYVVKSYIDSWGGEISAESKFGKGSTFSVRLPFKIKTAKKDKSGGVFL